MRHLISLGLMVALCGLAANFSSAQALKNEPKEEVKWPKEVQGKNLETWVREMKEAKDASTRDTAIRTVPAFGPAARKAASANLLYAITKDPDINVRLAAVAMVPILGFDTEHAEQGMNAIADLIKPTSAQPNHTRYEVTMALANCGYIAKRAIPTLVNFTMVDPSSWRMRKAAAYALGRLGQPEMEDDGPDVAAIRGLIKCVRQDTSHEVRREAMSSLLLLGPPFVEAPWRELRDALALVIKVDSDKTVVLWAHVVMIRSETEVIKPNNANLAAISKLLTSPDQALRIEAIQALGVLGEASKSKLTELLAILANPKEDAAVLIVTIWTLSQIPSEATKTLPIISDFKSNPNEGIKRAALDASDVLIEKKKVDVKKDMKK